MVQKPPNLTGAFVGQPLTAVVSGFPQRLSTDFVDKISNVQIEPSNNATKSVGTFRLGTFLGALGFLHALVQHDLRGPTIV